MTHTDDISKMNEYYLSALTFEGRQLIVSAHAAASILKHNILTDSEEDQKLKLEMIDMICSNLEKYYNIITESVEERGKLADALREHDKSDNAENSDQQT